MAFIIPPNPPLEKGDLKPRLAGRLPIILLLAVLAGLAGCKPPEAERTYGGPDTGPAYGDVFIDASIGDANTLLPPLISDAASSGVASFIYNGLVKYDGDLTLRGDL